MHGHGQCEAGAQSNFEKLLFFYIQAIFNPKNAKKLTVLKKSYILAGLYVDYMTLTFPKGDGTESQTDKHTDTQKHRHYYLYPRPRGQLSEHY